MNQHDNDHDDAMNRGKGSDIPGKTVHDMIHCVRPVSRRKKIFGAVRISGHDPRKQEHSGFTWKVSEIKKNFDTGEIGLSIKIMDFLSSWLQKHIKGVDKSTVFFSMRRT